MQLSISLARVRHLSDPNHSRSLPVFQATQPSPTLVAPVGATREWPLPTWFANFTLSGNGGCRRRAFAIYEIPVTLPAYTCWHDGAHMLARRGAHAGTTGRTCWHDGAHMLARRGASAGTTGRTCWHDGAHMLARRGANGFAPRAWALLEVMPICFLLIMPHRIQKALHGLRA